MAEILVIGGASLDILHFAGQTAISPGGAGMYTALTVVRAGAHATMLAPRPDPVPDALAPVAARVNWTGPRTTPDKLPHFEIAHHGNGKAELVNATWGAEARLTPEFLPNDLGRFDIIHIAALGTAQRQLDFLRACRERGARKISAGTYACVVYRETETVRALFDAADFFFCNENEARGLFGSLESARTRAGKFLFVTRGEHGAIVLQGDHTTMLDAEHANELDPTGAGDTFCGATLAGIARGQHPVIAAQLGISLAAQTIQAIGPAALLRDDALPMMRNARVHINATQVERVARVIASLDEVTPFNFVGDDLPPENHPATLDSFFVATAQQFGFWSERDGHYHLPLIATLDGKTLKGSDYLWRAYVRRLSDANFYSPAHQANLTRDEMLALFHADDGTDPMPALDLHLAIANAYGRDLLALELTPRAIVDRANASPKPLQTFLQTLDHIGGYKADPLRKKASLLALVLTQRPEKFLRTDEPIEPVIDYHLMRSGLRVGLIEICDESLASAIRARQVVVAKDEWAIRSTAFDAIVELVRASGKSIGAVDWFFFNARRRCPEMSAPDCAHCVVDSACAHRKELFQPVFRTSAY